jgi:hypothetical protein
MAAGINDKFKKTYNAANPNVARVSSTRAALGTTLACDNLAGWPTDTAVDFSTYQIDSSNAVVAGTQTDWKGIVSGNNIGTLTRITGATDSGSAVGDVVEMNPTGNWANDLMTGILVHSNQDGTLKSNAVTTSVITDANVTTSKLANASVTADKLGLSPQANAVLTAQGTSSTSYTNLATTGPSVTATIGANGLALVIMSALITVSGAGVSGSMTIDVSGANTIAASDEYAKNHTGYTSDTGDNDSRVFLLTGLTPGSTTFTAKYKTSSGTSTFTYRKIAVIPL